MRRCLITGVSGAIGAAIADVLIDGGYAVVGIGRRKPEKWKKEFMVADLSDETTLTLLPTELSRKFDQLWGLINVAGQGLTDSVEALAPRAVGELIRLNSIAPAALTAAASPLMRLGGRIVSISSIVAAGKPHRSAYAASKAALNAFSSCWARELGPRGITSNVIAPGPVDTPLLRSVLPKGSEDERALLERIPTRRFTDPNEIAQLVRFLLSDAAANLNGQVINFDGGLHGGAA